LSLKFVKFATTKLNDMLLLNGKPVADDFFIKYAAATGTKLEDYILKKAARFRLAESFFTTKRQREMKTGAIAERQFVAPEFHIEPSIKWSNPMTGMTDILSYVVNFIPDNNGVHKGYTEPITFEYGWLTVDAGQNDLYFFLNQHGDNKTNPKYLKNGVNPSRPPKFMESMPDLESNSFVNYELSVAKVITKLTDKEAKGYVNDEVALSLAKAYGIGNTIGKGRNDINKFLIDFAKKNPTKLLDDLTSAATEIRAVLADCIAFNVIKWDMPYVKWVDVSKGKRSVNNGIICQIPNGLDEMDYFVQWMREKDNSGVYNQLKKELEDKKLAAVEELTA